AFHRANSLPLPWAGPGEEDGFGGRPTSDILMLPAGGEMTRPLLLQGRALGQAARRRAGAARREGAAPGQVPHGRNSARDIGEALCAAPARDRAHEALRIGMNGVVEEVVDRRFFDLA